MLFTPLIYHYIVWETKNSFKVVDQLYIHMEDMKYHINLFYESESWDLLYHLVHVAVMPRKVHLCHQDMQLECMRGDPFSRLVSKCLGSLYFLVWKIIGLFPLSKIPFFLSKWGLKTVLWHKNSQISCWLLDCIFLKHKTMHGLIMPCLLSHSCRIWFVDPLIDTNSCMFF